MANDPVSFYWRAFLQRWCSFRLARSITTFAILALCLPATSWADDIAVTVVFTNGDRLTGTLEALNVTQLQFRPLALHTLGDVLSLRWNEDALAELDLGPGCLYPTQKSADGPPKRISGPLPRLCFQGAVVRPSSSDTISITTEDGRTLSSVASLTLAPAPPAPAMTSASKDVVATPAAAPPTTSPRELVSMWSLGLNAPESAVNATQSSQSLGGSLFSNLYFGDPNHLIISASGIHQHNYSPGKSSIKTDTFDSIVQFGHTFGTTPSTKFTFYQVGEWFFNTSLGLAAQRSVGAGLFLPTWRSRSENFSFKVGADLRYFNERIYGPQPVLDLVGSRIQAQSIYKASDRKWFISAVTWINPMWNNEEAWQGYANLTLSLPFGKHVCLDFTPANDEYLENAPHGDRKNYLSSTATLKITAGPNPGQVCGQ